MREKILAAFKAKYPNVNLSKTRLDELIPKIETKIDGDEAKIDATLDEFNGFVSFESIAKQDDQLRNLLAKNKPAPPKEKTETDPPADDPTAKLLEAIGQLTQKVTALESKEAGQTRQAALKQKLKDIPENFWLKRPMPSTDEEMESFVTDVTTDYTAFQQDLVDKGLAVMPKPGGGAGSGGASGKVSAEIKDFIEKNAN